MIKKSNLDNKLALLDKQNDTPNNEVYLNNINMDGSLNNNNLGFKIGNKQHKKTSAFLAIVIALSFLGSGTNHLLDIKKFMGNTANHEQIEFENKPIEINSQIHLKSNNNNNIIENIATAVVENNLFENKVLISSNDSSMIYPLTIENKSKAPQKQSFLLKKDKDTSDLVKKTDVKKTLTVKQASLAGAVTEKYNVDKKSAEKIIKEAYNVGKKRGIDPEILIGITAVESGFNPKAKNRSGAIGLTQALPRAHPEKIKRVKKSGGSMYDIHTNLDVGAEIYGELLDKYNGNTVLALQAYNGSVKDKKKRYSKKVMNAISTLKTMSLAYND
ncbi:lytic transglycosylase domain-containing protein [Shigella flexneri]